MTNRKLKAVESNGGARAARVNNTQTKTPLKLVGGTDFEKQFRELDLNLIEPGENWRKIIDTPDFELFVENIKANGVLETILVAPADERGIHRIIAGERRYQASKKAGLTTIPARIMTLSDDKLLDAHIAENFQRKDLEPMEEAEGLAKIIAEAEARQIHISVSELARRVGKPAVHIAKRLVLNGLIPEAKADLRAGLLDVKIAEEIAPHKQSQQEEIYQFCFDKKWKGNVEVLDKSKPRSLRTISEKISSQVLLDLKFAPFPKKSDQLRADGLVCADCKTRTGATELLYPEMNQAKKDYCMDKECFSGKFQKHVELVQISVARKNIVKTLPKLKKGETLPEIPMEQISAEIERLPKLSPNYYNSENNLLSPSDYTEIKNQKVACASAVTGIFMKGERVGKTSLVCLASSKCPTHYRRYAADSSKQNSNPGDDYKKNRQQLFDLRSDQIARRKVLGDAVALFDENKTVWHDDKLRLLMLASMIQSLTYNERHRRSLIADLLGLEESVIDTNVCGSNDAKIFDIYEKVSQLPEAVQSKLFFLMTCASFGENHFEARGIKQTHVEFLAEHLDINYNLRGAEARVDLCAEKYKKQLPEAKLYLEKVQQSSEPLAFPNFFFDFEAEKKAAENKNGETLPVAA